MRGVQIAAKAIAESPVIAVNRIFLFMFSFRFLQTKVANE